MDEPLGLILRVAHVFCGVFWAGAAIMLAGFITPAVEALGADGGKFIQRMMGAGRFGMFMSAAGVLTSATGIAMFWYGTGATLGSWLSTGFGTSIVIGSTAGLVALVSGLAVNAPTALRLAQIGRDMQSAGGRPGPEQVALFQKLQRRLRAAGVASAVLLAAAVVAMAAARYV